MLCDLPGGLFKWSIRPPTLWERSLFYNMLFTIAKLMENPLLLIYEQYKNIVTLWGKKQKTYTYKLHHHVCLAQFQVKYSTALWLFDSLPSLVLTEIFIYRVRMTR